MREGQGRQLRRWCVVGVWVFAAFALYGSLLPFDFTGPFTLGRLVEAARLGLSERLSRTDFVANVLLFFPIGLCAGAAFVQPVDSARRRRAAALVVFIGVVALSVVCEALQAFLPDRTTSLADVVAETGGATAALWLWLIFGAEITEAIDTWSASQGRLMVQIWLTAFVIGRAIYLVLPLDVSLNPPELAQKYRSGLVILNPLYSPALRLEYLPSALLAFVLSLPVGVWAMTLGVKAGGRRDLRLGLVLSTLAVGSVTLAQVFVVSRQADVGEFLVNAAGAGAGVMLASIGRRRADAVPSSGVSAGVATAGLLLALGFYALYNWSPFDFQVSADLIRSRAGRLFDVPFAGYQLNADFAALGEALSKTILGLPIGVFLQLRMRNTTVRFRRLATGAALLTVFVFLFIVEAGQVVLPSRFPDDTDVLLAFGGVLIGAQAVRVISKLVSARSSQ